MEKELRKNGYKGVLKKQYPLKNCTYFKIGGNTQYYLVPQKTEDCLAAIEYCHQSSTPFFILGSGSNLLADDQGFKGAVIALNHESNETIEVLAEDQEYVWLNVPASCSKFTLLRYALLKSYSGLEFSAGIPGTLGGAVYMNAGTKWGSYSEVIQTVKLYSSKTGLIEKTCSEMGFKYRGLGDGVLDGQTTVLSVSIKLKKEKTALKSRRLVDEILCYRGQKQPLERPNCGSVFKNPKNSEKGAGRLIEAAGLKGLRVGQAQVSLKHANFILNTGQAKSADVKELILRIQDAVSKKFNIQLEREVIYL